MSQPETLYIENDLTENFTHKGSLVIEGNVAPGVSLTVIGGDLIIDGNVGANADIMHTALPDATSQCEITGNTDDTVKLASNAPIVIKGAIGDSNEISSTRSVTARSIGSGNTIGADGTIAVEAGLGTNNILRSDGATLITGNIGAYNEIESGHNILVEGSLGFDCKLKAKGNITTGNIAPKCTVKAGGAIDAGYTSRQATLEAGGKVTQKGQAMDQGYAAQR